MATWAIWATRVVPAGPMPMEGEAAAAKPEDLPKGQKIRRTEFMVQFVWQPVPKDEREVNDIMHNLLLKHQAQNQNLDLPFEQIQQAVDKVNEKIAENNAKIRQDNKLLPEGDPSRQSTPELLKVTPEQYDAFKQRFLVKGTPETLPQKVAPAAGSGEGGAMDAPMGGH